MRSSTSCRPCRGSPTRVRVGTPQPRRLSGTSRTRCGLSSLPLGITVRGLHFGAADTDIMAGFDGPKLDLAVAAGASRDGVERDAADVVVDDWSAAVKASLSHVRDVLRAVRMTHAQPNVGRQMGSWEAETLAHRPVLSIKLRPINGLKSRLRDRDRDSRRHRTPPLDWGAASFRPANFGA